MENDKVNSTLNELIETSLDGARGFKTCAEDIDDPQLKSFFTERASSCETAAKELQQVVSQHGGTPTATASVGGILHRRWIDIKSAITGKDKVSILEECERGEDVALNTYKKALDADLPSYARQIVERQLQGVQRNHDQVKQMRDQARGQAAH
ncbi:MAG TPA: PA2169 family four-helix-bundle protein [Burkholderiaceae bacterium]